MISPLRDVRGGIKLPGHTCVVNLLEVPCHQGTFRSCRKPVELKSERSGKQAVISIKKNDEITSAVTQSRVSGSGKATDSPDAHM